MASLVSQILRNNNIAVGGDRDSQIAETGLGDATVKLTSMHVVISEKLCPMVANMMKQGPCPNYRSSNHLRLEDTLNNERTWDITIHRDSVDETGSIGFELAWNPVEILDTDNPLIQQWNNDQKPALRVQKGDIVVAVGGMRVAKHVNREMSNFRSGRSSTLKLTLARSVPKTLAVPILLQDLPNRAASDPGPAFSARETIRTCSTGANPRVPFPGWFECENPAAFHFESPWARDRDYGPTYPFAARLPRYQQQGVGPSTQTHTESGDSDGDGLGGGSHQHRGGGGDSHGDRHASASSDSERHSQAQPQHRAGDQDRAQDAMLEAAPFANIPSRPDNVLLNLQHLASCVFGGVENLELKLSDQERWKRFLDRVVRPWLDIMIVVEALGVNMD
mmetsp:Transcript_174189/g.558572  ORF Transcript_174189/g.558572 Transcript_174189/m.558572 type:complete len:392 (+) Transcript_174189:441-1616(+)|eukprot:CAMPEP_0203952366 /NCGR_PEP_ID=MMETSP0359-20131031/86034_1 /ASSEMBLY_ACC=CAM_ASM_000338 /TAXON_ID=268821 /ORGANISM="Scrippsiella Hangoei, Strain SHTV-5" /LENGTH=391 /DNA_ID=CAMNT_0050885335 /DNA_START=347 /DNA_END=1522 /DNA_ORIENTATION=-